MNITFPLPVADFWETLRFANRPEFVLQFAQKQSMDGGGNILGASFGTPKWAASVQIAGGWHDKNLDAEAMLKALEGRFGTFLAYDIRRPFPAADPLGTSLDSGSKVAIGGEAAYGDVSLGTYRYEGSAVTLTQAVSIDSDAGTHFDADGVLQTAAADVLRVDYGPFANYIRNFKVTGAVAGTPGTAPSNWTIDTVTGLTRSIVGTGVENGIAYVDIRFAGTASASTNWGVYFETGTYVRAASGQTWNCSVYLALVAGSVPNCNLSLAEYSSGGAFLVGSGAVTPLTAALTRFNVSRTVNHASLFAVRPFAWGSLVNGQTYDFTIRVGVPLLNLGSTPISYPRVPLGMLAETAFTNIVLRSREFDNAAWTKSLVTVTANAAGILDPWGTALAEKVVESSDAVAQFHFIYKSYTTANPVNHVGYCIAKAGERTKIRLAISNFSTGGGTALFDLITGTVSDITSAPTDMTGTTARMFSLGNGWWWCEVETLKTLAVNSNAHLQILPADASGATQYIGDGVSGFYLAHAQLEEGTLGHMPLVTTTAAIARAADALTMRAKGTNTWTLTYDDGSVSLHTPGAGNWPVNIAFVLRPRIKGWNAVRTAQPSASAVQIKSKGSNNRSIALKGLPPFFIVTKGDKISVTYSATKVFLCEAMETIVADYLGETAEFEIQPFLPAGIAVNDAVTLKKPPGKFKLVAGSYRPASGQGNISSGVGFSMVSAP